MKRLRLVWPMLLPATCTPCTLTISPLTHRLPSPAQYVELPELMAERAVQVLNHRNMGSRYVEVFLSSEGEMSQANVAPPVSANGAPWQMDMGSGGAWRRRPPGECALRTQAPCPVPVPCL